MFNPVLLKKQKFTQNALVNKLKFGENDCPIGSVVQTDGKVLVFGNFENYGGVYGRNNLIRLNSNGTVDTSFCVNAIDGAKFSSTVSTVKIQADGKILVGGNFNAYGSTIGRDRLIRLNSDGTLDNAFCINSSDNYKFSDRIRKIEIYTHASLGSVILVAGDFTNYNSSVGRNFIIALDLNGNTIASLNTALTGSGGPNAPVYTIAVANDSSFPYQQYFILGGAFTAYNGSSTFNYVARILNNCSLGAQIGLSVSPGSVVYTVSVGSSGAIIVGGYLLNIQGVANRNHLAAFTFTDTGPPFNLKFYTFDSSFSSLYVDGGKFSAAVTVVVGGYVGGSFTNYNGISGRSYLLDLNSGSLFNPTFVDNKFSASGQTFGYANGVLYSGNGITTTPGSAFFLMNKIQNYNNKPNRNGLFKITSSTTIDESFCANASDGPYINNNVRTIVSDLNGSIYIGGNFTNYKNITGMNGLVKFNSDGTFDSTFSNNASGSAKFGSGTITHIVPTTNGSVLVAGTFTNYGGQPGRNKLILLNPDGTLNTFFCSNASDGNKFSGNIYAICYRPEDETFLIGGSFLNYGTINRNNLIRLDMLGLLDSAFCALASDGAKINGSVLSITVQEDPNLTPRIIFSGGFTNYDSSNRSYLIGLNYDGSTDVLFSANSSSGTKFSDVVRCVLAEPFDYTLNQKGKVLVGGDFENYAGTTRRNYLIKLNNNGTVDSNFCLNGVDDKTQPSSVFDIALKENKNVVFMGNFSSYDIYTTRGIVELDKDGYFYQIFDGLVFGNPALQGGITSIGNNLFYYGNNYNCPYGSLMQMDRVKNII